MRPRLPPLNALKAFEAAARHESFTRHADWTKWLRMASISDDNVKHGPVLNRESMVIDAAINGQGIALARTTLAAWDLINGRLMRPFTESLRLSKTYWIVCPKAASNTPKIVTFRDWLLAEASRDLDQLKQLAIPDRRAIAAGVRDRQA